MKRKMLSRLMAASLAAIMTVGMVGCGDNTDGSSDSGNVGNQGSDTGNQGGDTGNQGGEVVDGGEDVGPYGAPLVDPATGKTYDLGGMEIIVADWFTGPAGDPRNDYEEALNDYHDWLQETYKFTLVKENHYGWGDANQILVQMSTSAPEGNIIYCIPRTVDAVSAMQAGLMYDVATLDCVDFTEDKWTKNGVSDAWRTGDSVYCFYAGGSEPRTGVYFNRRVLEDAGINPDSIYEMQSNGTWTWDAWVDMMSKVQRDTNADGEIDVYGCVQNNGNMIMAAVISNGANLVTRNADGTYTLAVNSDAASKALHWATDEITTKWLEPYDSAENWEMYKDLFKSGTAAFMVEDGYAGTPGNFLAGSDDIAAMEDDYGFALFPKGPDADAYYWKQSNNLFCLPANYDADTAWKIMFAYNLWTDDVPGYEGYDGQMVAYYQGMRDVDAVDNTVKYMTSGHGVDTWHELVSGLDTNAPFLWSLYAGADVDAVIDGVIVPWQTAIDEANAKMK